MVGDGTYLTVSEAVTRLGGIVGEQTVRRLCDDGVLRSIRLPGRRGDRRIVAASVDEYLARLTGESAAESGPVTPSA